MLNTFLHAGDEPLADIEFADMVPLEANCDLVGVSPLEAIATIPPSSWSPPPTRPFDGEASLAPEDMPTEEYAAFQ
jgi:hypothetical protein